MMSRGKRPHVAPASALVAYMIMQQIVATPITDPTGNWVERSAVPGQGSAISLVQQTALAKANNCKEKVQTFLSSHFSLLSSLSSLLFSSLLFSLLQPSRSGHP